MTIPPLTPDERSQFNSLIAASAILVTVCRNAATVLSEEFENMVTGPADVVAGILSSCPTPILDTWDGKFEIDACDEERFTPDLPYELRAGRINVGVKLMHRPTGQSVTASSAPEYDVNRQRAIRALKDRVERISRARRDDPLL